MMRSSFAESEKTVKNGLATEKLKAKELLREK